MFIIVSIIGKGTERNIILLAKQIIIGVVVYFGFLVVLRAKVIGNTFNLVRSKLKKGSN